MPFNPNTKARMFIKSARICCLCFKQCGTNIEAAHIIAEADGGPNTDDNGIPLCFDCHQEIGGYDVRHPKGNKFTETELKARRNQVYDLVESGFLQAQIITGKLHENIDNKNREQNSHIKIDKYNPTKEIKAIIELAQNELLSAEPIPFKLQLLNDREQAYVIDELVDNFDKSNFLEPLFTIISNENFENKSLIILEQILRKVTILMDLNLKKNFMCQVPLEILKTTDEGLRIAFFTELIGILERNQFTEVNKITSCIIRIQTSIPENLIERYFRALIKLSDSGAWDAEPIAKRTLLSLPDDFAIITLSILDEKILVWDLKTEFYTKLINEYLTLWPKNKQDLFSDYLNMNKNEFNYKYM